MSRMTPKYCPYCGDELIVKGVCLLCESCRKVIDAGNSILKAIFSQCYSGYKVENEATPSSFKFQWAFIAFLLRSLEFDMWEEEEKFIWSGYENQEYIIRVGQDRFRRKEWKGKNADEAMAKMLEEVMVAYRKLSRNNEKTT